MNKTKEHVCDNCEAEFNRTDAHIKIITMYANKHKTYMAYRIHCPYCGLNQLPEFYTMED